MERGVTWMEKGDQRVNALIHVELDPAVRRSSLPVSVLITVMMERGVTWMEKGDRHVTALIHVELDPAVRRSTLPVSALIHVMMERGVTWMEKGDQRVNALIHVELDPAVRRSSLPVSALILVHLISTALKDLMESPAIVLIHAHMGQTAPIGTIHVNAETVVTPTSTALWMPMSQFAFAQTDVRQARIAKMM